MSHEWGTKEEMEARRQALKKLEEGVAAFNDWRKANRRKWIKLKDSGFAGAVLDGIDFHGVKFTGSDFRGASLKDALFVSANLNKVDFTGADLRGADFQGARMHGTILQGADVTDAQFNGALRDGWSIHGVKCDRCWITRIKKEFPGKPEEFAPGEFESVYGGARVKVVFNNGFEPIDLAALPYYVNSFSEKFPDKKLMFVGLNALGTPSLEFRVENERIANDAREEMQQHLNDEVTTLREVTADQLKQKDWQIEQKDQQIRRLFDLVEQSVSKLEGTHMIVKIQNSGPTMIQEKGVQIGSINFGDPGQLAALAKDIETLIEKYSSRNDAPTTEKKALDEALVAAKANNEAGVMKALKKAGKSAMEFAKDVGVELAAEAIKQAIGMKG